MSAQITAIRGPLLNCTHDTRFPDSSDSMVYIRDALIILDNEKILEFGPAKSLKHKLDRVKLITINRKCRIIKSFVSF